MNTHTLKIEKLCSGYDNIKIVDNVSIEIPNGKISVILGANGSGKSTLLKTLVRLVKKMDGTIQLDGAMIDDIPTKKIARIMGLLPQSPIVPEGISVIDLVSRGRYPHRSFLEGWTSKDTESVAKALETMGITSVADKNIDELSGGQRQRVWIAMALAQETDILFLDEPTTYLDITYQVEILDLLTDLNLKNNTTIIMVLHDINLAARYADNLFIMKKGKLLSQGKPQDVLSESLIKDAFGLECNIIQDPVSNTPFLIPKGRHHVINK